MSRAAFIAVVLALMAACAPLIAFVLVSGYAPARGASKPPSIFSVRTERGAHGHTLTTVAFPVRADDGNTYLCVVTEDVGDGNGTGVVSVAQSCDFSVSLSG